MPPRVFIEGKLLCGSIGNILEEGRGKPMGNWGFGVVIPDSDLVPQTTDGMDPGDGRDPTGEG